MTAVRFLRHRNRCIALLHASTALLLACTYFAFRVELFEEEFEAHQREMPSGIAWTAPTLSWETFDKENAPQAFSVQVLCAAQLGLFLPPPPSVPIQDRRPYQPIRDKSPPSIPAL